MSHVNRIVMIVVLLIAIVVCGLVIRNLGNELQQSQTQLMAVQGQVSRLETTMQSFQTATTQEIDALNTSVATLQSLVNDLGLQVVN